MNSSPKMNTPSGLQRYEVNMLSVWGQMATGGGPNRINETMANLGVPGLSIHAFTSIEHEIGKMWLSILGDQLLKNVQEERKLAEQLGHFHEGVPWITVVADGGWSKCSHKHIQRTWWSSCYFWSGYW